MGGIIGRLFREFAVTITMTHRRLGLRLADADADDGLALPAAARQETQHGRFYELTERGFDAHARRLRARPRFRAAPPLRDAAACSSPRWRSPVYLFVIIPKGFFPQQDTGLITGISEAGAGRLVCRDDAPAGGARRDRRARIRPSPPRHGDRRRRLDADAQQRPLVHHAEAARASATSRRGQVIARLRPQAREGRGRARSSCRRRRTSTSAAALARTQFQYTLQDANLDELNAWAPKVLEKLKTLPMLRDVATDQQTSGTTLTLTIDRDQAARYGLTPQLIDDTLYDAFGQRQVAQYFTQQNSYHVVMEVLPELQGDPRQPRQDLHPLADDRPAGAARDLRQMDDAQDRAALDQPPGPVPGGHHQLQPGARAWRSARRRRRSSSAEREMQHAARR